MFCEKCGATIEDGVTFCPQCGQNIDNPQMTETEEKAKRKFPLFPALSGIIILIIIAGVSVFIFQKSVKKTSSVIYLKDNDLYSVQGKKPYELGGRSYYEDKEQTYTEDYNIKLSADKKYIYYPASKKNGLFSLYCRLYGKKNAEAVKIATSVSAYEVLPNKNVVYLDNGSNKLYLWNMKTQEKEKIESDVSAFYVSEDGKKILFAKAEGKVKWYVVDTKLKEETKKIYAVASLYSNEFSSDFNTIVYQDHDKLNIICNLEDKKRVASGVKTWTYCEKENVIYYVTDEEKSYTYMDFIEDDFAKEDSHITKPDIRNYQHEEIVPSFWGSRTEVVTDDAYYDDCQKYDEKMARDQQREYYESEITSIGTGTLYRYDISKGESQKLSEDVYRLQHSYDMQSLLFSVVSMKSLEKVKFSELESDEQDIETAIAEKLQKQQSSVVLYDGNTYPVNKEKEFENTSELSLITVLPNKTAYFRVQIDKTEYLCTASLEGDKIQFEKLADDFAYLEAVAGNGIYYIADADKNGDGDLYFNDEKIASDVAGNSVKLMKDGQSILYLADRTNDYMEGDLMLYDGKKETKIDSDACDYFASEDGNVAYLKDYNWNKNRGDMKRYKNGKVIACDEDVTAILYY